MSSPDPTPPTVIKPRYVELDYSIGSLAGLTVVLLNAEPSEQFLQELDTILSQLERAYSNDLSLLLVVNEVVSAIGEALRETITSLLRNHRFVCAALVIEGSGFSAASKRASLSLVRLTVRTGFPVRVVGTVSEAGAWLESELSERAPHITADRIQHAVFALAYRAKRDSIPDA